MSILTEERLRVLRAEAAELAREHRGAPTTMRTRTQAIKSWRRFAGKEVPTDELALLYVVQEIKRNRKPSGIKTYLSGIRAHFRLRNSPVAADAFSHWKVKEALKQGALRIAKAGHGVKRAIAWSVSQVKKICLGARTYDERLFAALIVTLFFNISRGAECVVPGHVAVQRYNKIPLYGNTSCSKRKVSIRIMSTKTAQFRTFDLTFDRENTPDWALHALFLYVRARGAFGSGLLAFPELFLRADGVSPTTSWLMRMVKRALGNEYTIHGIRAGGATRMAEEGYSAFEIQLAGRWTSDAFLAYIDETPSLAKALARKGNLPQARRRVKKS
jgi:hypothetical protein